MLYQTSIPIGAIDEDELQSLVNSLGKVWGQKVDMEKQIVISTDSSELSLVLDSMADTIRNGPPVAAKVQKKKK